MNRLRIVTSSWFRLSVALGASVVGSLLTLHTIVLLNAFVDPRSKDDRTIVSFSVPTVKSPTDRPKPPPAPPRSQPRSNQRSLAPLPDLGGGGGSGAIAIDVPDYSQADLGGAGQSLLGTVEDVAMTADTVDKPPVVRNGPLTYPERAKQRGLEGRVTVSILIGTDGRVQKSKILDASPPGVFDQAVLEALPRWTFAPAEYQGRPVPIWVTLPLDFSSK